MTKNVWQDGFNFPLTEEVLLAQETARSFAQEKVKPLAEKIDKEHYFPKQLISEIGKLGFMGAAIPEKYGGSELPYIAYALIIEELSATCASTGIIVSAHHSLCLAPILDYGTVQQKERYLKPLARGEKLGCFALSEPSTGSDAASMTCTVKKVNDKYIINGVKNWITNGPEADVAVLFATIDRSKGYKGICAFVHDMNLDGINIPGLTRGKKEDKLGIRGSGTCSLTYENVELTKENLLFEEGKGFTVAMTTLNGGRIGVAAQAVGIARSALEDALNYSKERSAFGKKLHEHQSVQNYLAEMITEIDAARYLTLSAAQLKDDGKEYARQAAMAKLHASKTAVWAANLGIQIHGGYGYVTDFPAERHLRDAKITEIYEGTSEIQKIVIGGALVKYGL